MRINKMTASFGKLENESLSLHPGLNVIYAPNESGKSTWCAFIRAMLYGVDTAERARAGYLPDKLRYAPWSGAPMAGEIELTWRGQDITLRRFAKGASPFGGFEAVYTGTGEAVSGLTAENCGEVLLGVGRETFQRTAFVGQSGVPIDADPDLEKRIAALVSSGEEDVSYSQTEKTLRGWLNRRRHNKTGLIPRLEEERTGIEGELAQMRQLTRQAGEAESQRDELTARKGALEAEAAAQKARQEWARREQYKAAVAELEAARRELADLEAEAGPLPDKEKLRQAQGAEFPGISTGLIDLDRRISGLNNSDLLILAARPGMGKTSLALNIALEAGKNSGKNVAIFSLEMSREQLVLRLISNESFVDNKKLVTGKLNESDWEKVAAAADALNRTKILIDDDSTVSVADINAKCRRVEDLGLVVIDYLQLMQSAGGKSRGNENRQQIVSDISRSLKIMAKELNVPVLCLSQLSRANESRTNKRPMLSDLRESGAIEQDADIVMFLYREDYYEKESENHNLAECIIAKNRHGETRTVELQWLPEYTTFSSIDRTHEEY